MQSTFPEGALHWTFFTKTISLSIIFVLWVSFFYLWPKLFGKVFKTASYLPEQQFEVKFCFWKDYIFLFFSSSGPWAKFLYYWRNFFPMYDKSYLLVSQATFLENTDFTKKLNLLNLLGTQAIVFGFYQENFGRVFSTAFCVLTRKFPDFVPKISFPVVFVFWTTFLSTFSVPLEVGCQRCVYNVMRIILMWRNLKKTIFSNLNSEESFFILSASIFPQCCLNCTLHFQRDISGVFFIEKKKHFVLSFPDFWQ